MRNDRKKYASFLGKGNTQVNTLSTVFHSPNLSNSQTSHFEAATVSLYCSLLVEANQHSARITSIQMLNYTIYMSYIRQAA
ncbi:hypothetical protein Hanom_Chr16g01508581 [Helianthus anomalus]